MYTDLSTPVKRRRSSGGSQVVHGSTVSTQNLINGSDRLADHILYIESPSGEVFPQVSPEPQPLARGFLHCTPVQYPDALLDQGRTLVFDGG